MAILYRTDGTFTEVCPENGRYFSLEELQRYVGGYIEYVETTDPDHLMVINEDGRLLGKLLNFVATALYNYGGTIVGDVVVGLRSELEGPPDEG